MVGPDDIDPVHPYERYPSDDGLRARWRCPRCLSDNSSVVGREGTCPCVCRHCLTAANVEEEVRTERLAWRRGMPIVERAEGWPNVPPPFDV